MNLEKKSINQLRKTATSLGIKRSAIDGKSKEDIIKIINDHHKAWMEEPEHQKLVAELDEYLRRAAS